MLLVTSVTGGEIRHQHSFAWPRYRTVVSLLVPSDASRLDWVNPDYVATVVGVLVTAAVVFLAVLTQSGLTVNDVMFVVLGISVPVTLARELTRRYW